MNAEHDIQGVPESDWSERGEKLTVFRLVPIGRETIWHTDEEGVALDLESLRRFEPGSNDLLRKLPTSLVEQATPDVRRSQ
jgi:hypothetical protein